MYVSPDYFGVKRESYKYKYMRVYMCLNTLKYMFKYHVIVFKCNYINFLGNLWMMKWHVDVLEQR